MVAMMPTTVLLLLAGENSALPGLREGMAGCACPQALGPCVGHVGASAPDPREAWEVGEEGLAPLFPQPASPPNKVHTVSYNI